MYTVKLTVGEEEFTQPLEVRKDPNSKGTMADIRANFSLVSGLVDDLDRAVEVINGAERIRSQLQALRRIHDGDDGADIRDAADTLERQFTEVEAQLIQLYSTGRGQDQIRWPMRLAQQIGSLAGNVQGSDFAPTQQDREVAEEMRAELSRIEAAYNALLMTDLPAFNTIMTARGVVGIVTDE